MIDYGYGRPRQSAERVHPMDAVLPSWLSARRRRKTRRKDNRRILRVRLPADLVQRVHDAVYWTKGLTLAGLCSRALNREVEALEHERGSRFPPRRRLPRRSKPGRGVGNLYA
jgi:hypothetical protein